MNCSKCGKPLDPDSLFCKYCGSQIVSSSFPQEAAAEPVISESSDQSKTRNKRFIALIILILSVIIAAVILIIVVSNNKRKKASSSYSSYSDSSYSSSYSSSYQMDHSTYCLLYMDISNVAVKHKGNYTYITGTITNNGTYQIKFVKVKAACKDRSGTTIDTDWTYAVDSTWLDPGESNTFEMMVKDESGKIKTADVTVVLN